MKITNKILALAIMAVAMVFASCSKDDDNDPVVPTQQEIETKIIGKWKSTMDMGMHKGEVLTNGRVIHSYNADHTGFASHSARTPEGYSWDNKSPFSFSLKGNVLSEKPEGEHIMERSFKITAIGDNSMTCELSMPAMPDEEKMPASVMTFTKVTADYSNDIIGMWEGVEMTGYETYGGIEARIEYKADGTYTYYKKVDGEWQPLADVIDEYNVDGDWLATRWQNNGSDVMNYEWWDIDYIKQEGDDTIMKWSALREKEGGERFTTTFTWKKVK